jgi:hypothetical protein
MHRWLIGVTGVLVACSTAAIAAPAPDLIGKSVLVSWTESRQQRVNGSEVRAVTVGFDLRIYVGGTGRPFTKLTAAGRRGPSSSNEQVGGAGASLGGGVRSVRADGHSITLQSTYGNYARNLRVDVGGGSCSAQMSVGKQVGSAPKAFRNTGGLQIEIHSVSVSGVTCSVRQGNVFAQ